MAAEIDPKTLKTQKEIDAWRDTVNPDDMGFGDDEKEGMVDEN